MADIHPFRGVRYDLSRVGGLSGLIAPPYDVIDEALSKKLHDASPFNAIRLELNPELPGDNDSNNRYTRAAGLLDHWKSEGVLATDPAPAIYVYFQTFSWEGQTFTRRGAMARCRLEKLGQGKIYPHEETMSGPKADRLRLFHATGMNTSQVFGLYPDEGNTIAERLSKVVAGKPALEGTDHLGVLHQLWVVTDPAFHAAFREAMRDKPIFIADGHHRYETGCRHLDETTASGLTKSADDPANFILMMLVGMSEPGLQVMPTHRLVSGFGGLTSARLTERLSPYFDVETMGSGEAAGVKTWDRIVASGRQDALGFCVPADGQWLYATLKDPKHMDAVVKDRSAAWKSLGVSILHKLVLEHALKPEGEGQCVYVHLTREVFDAVAAKECSLACLVQPATVEHIRQVAGTFEKMPAKSTYFYPKLASGLVFNPIR